MSAGMTNAEWAASLTVEDLDLLINRCVHERDFKGLSAALHLMAVKDPSRAEHWRGTLLLAGEVGKVRHAADCEPSQTSAPVDAPPDERATEVSAQSAATDAGRAANEPGPSSSTAFRPEGT